MGKREFYNRLYEQRKADYEAQRNAYGHEAVAKSGVSAANTYQIKAVFDQATAQFDAEHADERDGIEAFGSYLEERWQQMESPEAKYLIATEAVMQNADFEEMSQPGQSKITSGKNSIFPRGDATYDLINDIDGYRQTAKLIQAGTGQNNCDSKANLYMQINEDEKGIYNYLYATQGKAAADKYLDAIMPRFQERAYKEQQQYIEEECGNGDTYLCCVRAGKYCRGCCRRSGSILARCKKQYYGRTDQLLLSRSNGG